MSKLNNIYGPIFRRAREELGMTQGDIAQLADLSTPTISCAERGQNLNLDTFLSICEALDLDASAVVALMTRGAK